MAAVNTLSLGERLRDLIPKLREADRQLEEAISQMEGIFRSQLPEGAYGCVLLKAPSRHHADWAHLIYRDGSFWLDLWKDDRRASREELKRYDVREYKLLFLRRLRRIWLACGGDPTHFTPALRSVLPWAQWRANLGKS